MFPAMLVGPSFLEFFRLAGLTVANPSRDGSCGSSRPEGFLEEIGWMGFAYPRLRQRFAVLPAAAILGLFWGLLARTSHRLARLNSPRQSLAGVFRGIRSRHGRNARLDCLVLRTHTKHRARSSG
jgi:hypothetical protein